MCFDITCSCVDAGKDTCTSLNTSTDRSTRLRTSDACPYCMLLNPRINVEKNKLEKQNVTQKRGMLCRMYKRVICNRMVVSKHVINGSLNGIGGQIMNTI